MNERVFFAPAFLVFTFTAGACSSSSNSSQPDGGGGAETGANALLVNPSVSQTCQTCLSTASGNDCANQAKVCSGDSVCLSLNSCVNKCTNLNSGCIANCGNAFSTNAQSEWTGWFGCACNDCTMQCSLCTSGSGTDSGSGTRTCYVDNTLEGCSGTPYYCPGSDSPLTDNLATSCPQSAADPMGGTDYCCM